MALQSVQTPKASVLMDRDFSWLQGYVLRRTHPRSIFIDSVGLLWFVYYFWNHDWMTAIGFALVFRAAALLSAMKIDIQAFSQTMLGKIGLLHLHPLNLAIQMGGLIILLYGLWMHGTEMILAGLSLVFLGHIFGWERVDPRFGDTTR